MKLFNVHTPKEILLFYTAQVCSERVARAGAEVSRPGQAVLHAGLHPEAARVLPGLHGVRQPAPHRQELPGAAAHEGGLNDGLQICV